MSLAIDVLEPSALLIVCQVLDGALLTRLRGVKPGIGGAANVRFCLRLKEPDRNPKVIIDRTLAASATSSDQGAKLLI